ncbi:hypothetical protein AB0K09_02270 [Streptomyces sp. NPDC049577]|uniref:hypothetical protein n=1 Tax=Streptomyces sp. NPDC049577 TaxID=3155153 RepID=UPI0034303B4F
MSKRTTLAAAGCVVLIAAGSVACGPAEKLEAGAKVQRAFDKLMKQKSVATEVGFEADADKIFAALKGEDDFQRQDAETLAGMKLTYAVGAGKPLGDLKEGDKAGTGGFRLAKGGKTLVDVRYVDEKYYFQGDLKALSELPAASKSSKGREERGKFDEMLRKADELPPSLAAVKGALKGEWVRVDAATLEEFAKSAGGKGDQSGQLDARSQKQLLDAFRNALADNAEFKDAGGKDGADHVTVTVPARKAAAELAEGLKPLEKKLGEDGKLSDLKDVPDKNISFDVAIKDGSLSSLTFDVAQLDKKAKGELPLKVAFQGGAQQVHAPSGAKELKPQDLFGAGMFLAMNGRGDLGKDV